MSRSSTDVFQDIIDVAQLGAEDALRGNFEVALIRMNRLEGLIQEGRGRLQREIHYKEELDRGAH